MAMTLRELIKSGESSQVEFKKRLNDPYKVAKTISSFANSKGGYLLVGVEDNGLISGIEVEEEIYMLEQAATFYVEPLINLETKVEISQPNRSVLLVHIAESGAKPHQCLDQNGDWKTYVRSGAQCLLAAPSVIQAMKREYSTDLSPTSDTDTIVKESKNIQILLNYLSIRPKLTLKDFAKLVNISKRRAKVILVQLVNEGILYEHNHSDQQYFTKV